MSNKKILKTDFFKWLLLKLVIAICLYWTFFYLSCQYHFIIAGALNLFSAREFTLNLFFRVIPILIPIVIGTSSLMLSRYTFVYFNLIFEDERIRKLVQYCVSYFVFHLLIIILQPSNSEYNYSYLYENNLILFFDTFFAASILLYSVRTIYGVLMYSQPDKISNTILDKADQLAEVLKKDLKRGIKDKQKYEDNKERFHRYTGTFINLFVLAVKSKDNDTIQKHVHKIGDFTHAAVKSIKNDPITKEGKDSLKTKQDEAFIRKESLFLVKEIRDISFRFYVDLFEVAFVNKEFYACDKILEYLRERDINDEFWESYIPELLPRLFKTSMSYNYHGYSYDYCEKIAQVCQDIYVEKINDTKKYQDYAVYFEMLKEAIYHKQFLVLINLMKKIKEISELIDNNANIYKEIIHAGIYCLKIKSMTCFAHLLRSIVTFQFDINRLNSAFSLTSYNSHKSKVVDLFENILNSDQGLKKSIRNEDLFAIDNKFLEFKNNKEIFELDSYTPYLYLKMYVLFYSYYKLQLKISLDRIPEDCRNVEINNSFLKDSRFNFSYIRTLLLDLESHSDKWNDLFIEQFSLFLIQTMESIFNLEEKQELKKEVQTFSKSKFLNQLYKKVYWK